MISILEIINLLEKFLSTISNHKITHIQNGETAPNTKSIQPFGLSMKQNKVWGWKVHAPYSSISQWIEPEICSKWLQMSKVKWIIVGINSHVTVVLQD